MNEHRMYYFTSTEDTIYYLVDHQDKRYCIIPKEYHKLAQHLYGLHLNVLGKTIEDAIGGYELRTLDNFGEFN